MPWALVSGRCRCIIGRIRKRQDNKEDVHAQLDVYQLDSIQQVRELREEAAKYGVSIEQMMDDTRVAKELHGFTNVKDYYFAKDDKSRQNGSLSSNLENECSMMQELI